VSSDSSIVRLETRREFLDELAVYAKRVFRLLNVLNILAPLALDLHMHLD
jgi:hypothetical protein